MFMFGLSCSLHEHGQSSKAQFSASYFENLRSKFLGRNRFKWVVVKIILPFRMKVFEMFQIVHYDLNIFFVVATVLMYVLIVFVARRKVGSIWRSVSVTNFRKNSNNTITIVPSPSRMMKRYVAIQRRILRVVLVLAVSILLTNMSTLLLIQNLR